MKLKVYVAGPLSKGDILVNVQRGLAMGERLLQEGFVPYIPHLTYYWNKFYPHTWEEWLALDEEWILACDAILRLRGVSKGADREEVFARHNNIPVFTSFNELLKWAKKEAPLNDLTRYLGRDKAEWVAND